MSDLVDKNTEIKVRKMDVFYIILIIASLTFNIIQYVQVCKINNLVKDVKETQIEMLSRTP